jgi:DNA (cytosine-5)-methyltransferase 1
MLRVISELRPRYVVAENVRGAVNLALDTVYSGLVGEGYKVYPYVIPASAVGAPHQRERLFVVGIREDVADTYIKWQSQQEGAVRKVREWTSDCGRDSGKLMENPGCELRQGSKFGRADGVETGNRDADKSERPGGALLPTPVKEDYRRRGPNSKQQRLPEIVHKRKLSARNGGQLSADWVEALMGFPLGWTDLKCEEPEMLPWPALMGQDQYPWEPPRTCTKLPNRAARLKALGNSVVPAQAYPFFEAIAIMEMVSSPVRKREEEDGKNGS